LNFKIGDTIGYLKLIKYIKPVYTGERYASGNKKYIPSKFICMCKCGAIIKVKKCNLASGHTKSCGCYKSKLLTNRSTHRFTNHKLYTRYNSMLRRCFDKKDDSWINYGGRGISICNRWADKNSIKFNSKKFMNFIYDMGFPSSNNHTIDRVNNSGNYEPSNCRWATQKEQSRNTRFNKILNYKGKNYTLPDLADVINISPKTLSVRINDCGWSVEKAVETPLRVNKRTKEKYREGIKLIK